MFLLEIPFFFGGVMGRRRKWKRNRSVDSGKRRRRKNGEEEEEEGERAKRSHFLLSSFCPLLRKRPLEKKRKIGGGWDRKKVKKCQGKKKEISRRFFSLTKRKGVGKYFLSAKYCALALTATSPDPGRKKTLGVSSPITSKKVTYQGRYYPTCSLVALAVSLHFVGDAGSIFKK